jgi:multidrug efflux pump subunit AcrB
MDAIMRVQLAPHREHSAQEYASKIRSALIENGGFTDLEFSFDTGGMIRGALNEGKSTPINIRVTGKNMAKAAAVAEAIKTEVARIDGVVDARVIQRLNYPEYVVNVDRTKAADLGLNQEDVMRNVVAALNSSISFNKKNFWIDSVSHNQYFVGVQYPEKDITSLETMLDIPISSGFPGAPTIPLRTVATISRVMVPTEVSHVNIQPAVDLTMGISGRDLGHVSEDVAKVIEAFGSRFDDAGKKLPSGTWSTFEPGTTGSDRPTMKGSKIVLSGEYARMQQTFRDLGIGMILAVLLMYFLMVALDKSYIVPLTVMLTVPISIAGVFLFLFATGTAINVQSILGIIFIIGIKVANTVLMTDFAQEIRRHEGLTPTQAIRKAAAVRVRPVTMTALAAFFAMIPAAMALERGSEANAPLARAILGGLLAGEPATLFVLPCLYMLMVKEKPGQPVHEVHDQEFEDQDDNKSGHDKLDHESDHRKSHGRPTR